MTFDWLNRAVQAERRMGELREKAVQTRHRLGQAPPPHLAAAHAEAATLTEDLAVSAGRDMSAAFMGTFATWLGEAEEINRRLDLALGRVRPAGSAPASPSSRERLLDLCEVAAAAHRTYKRRLATIRLLSRMPQASIVGALRDQAARIVHGWDRWLPTHARLVSSAAAARRMDLGPIIAGARVAPAAAAVTTADFAEDYGRAVEAMDRYADAVLRQELAKWTAAVVAEPEIRALADLGDARRLLHDRLLPHAARETVDLRLRMMCTLFDDTLIACDPRRHPEDPVESRADDLVDRAALAVATSARFPLPGNRALPWHECVRAGTADGVDPIALLRIRRDLVEALTRYAMRRLQGELDLIHLTVLAHLEQVGALLPTCEEIDVITAGAGARR